MFPYSQLKEIHLEITNNCQASCPMCARNRNGGLENPLLQLTDWTLDEFKIIMNERLLHQLDGFFFCGSFGDPILNKDLLEMCRYSTLVNPDVNIRIHTNGSAKSTAWWAELATVLPKTHMVVFAIDGLEDTHSLYRVGTSYNKIIDNARAFIEAGGIAEWCFIKFKHNEHQVDEAKRRAEEFGFNRFVMKNSSRFLLEPKVDVVDKSGNVTHIIEPATSTPLKFIDKKVIQAYKTVVAESVIDCQSLHNREVHIDAFRTVLPCCWLAATPYTYLEQNDAYAVRHEMAMEYYDLLESLGGVEALNAVTHTVEDIINSKEYQNVWDTYWNEKKLITCARMCGRAPSSDFAKSRDQQAEIVKYE